MQNVIDLGTDQSQVFKQTYETYQQIESAIQNHSSKELRESLLGYKKNNTAMDKSINTLRKNIKYVSNSCTMPYSNGPLEGTIGKIKKLKRNCYGFRNLNHLLKRTTLICA